MENSNQTPNNTSHLPTTTPVNENDDEKNKCPELAKSDACFFCSNGESLSKPVDPSCCWIW